MVRAPINADTLKWARSVMHLEAEDVAHAAGTSLERALQFESGDEKPTLKQLEKIAKKLDRTMAFFFAPPPASVDIPQTPDFRGRSADPLPPLLAREMRRAELRRDTMLDLQGPPHVTARVGTITWANHAERAGELRRKLGLSEEFVPPVNRENQVFAFWRGLLGSHGYLVFQATKIPLSSFRGLSIKHDTLPVILLNGSDSNNGKAFTLFHEVAHLANRTSGLCSLNQDVNEEALANAFAANFLMPAKQVKLLVQNQNIATKDLADRVANHFKVSPLAAGVRLRTMNLIDEKELDAIRQESEALWKKRREDQKNDPGGPPAWRTHYRNLGSTYIGTVARAVDDSRVDWMDASYLLNARIPMVRQMFEEYYRTEAGSQ